MGYELFQRYTPFSATPPTSPVPTTRHKRATRGTPTSAAVHRPTVEHALKMAWDFHRGYGSILQSEICVHMNNGYNLDLCDVYIYIIIYMYNCVYIYIHMNTNTYIHIDTGSMWPYAHVYIYIYVHIIVGSIKHSSTMGWVYVASALVASRDRIRIPWANPFRLRVYASMLADIGCIYLPIPGRSGAHKMLNACFWSPVTMAASVINPFIRFIIQLTLWSFNIAIENNHIYSEFSHKKNTWWYSTVMLISLPEGSCLGASRWSKKKTITENDQNWPPLVHNCALEDWETDLGPVGTRRGSASDKIHDMNIYIYNYI